ncbi:MAG: hypothetical protein ACOCXE_03585 [Spirochaetota bacterium]
MRKATLLIAVLLCFGLATAFAGPVEVEPEYEAEASATWGVQLDEMTTGFDNSAESTIMFTFIEEQTEEYGEGTTYGYIEVADFEVEFEAAGEEDSEDADSSFSINVGEITGKVFFGPAYLVVYSGASDDVDELDGPGAIGGDIITPTQTVGDNPNVLAEPATEAGVALGYEVPDLVTLELGVESRYGWDDPQQDTDFARNAYVWSLNADITPVDGASVALVSNMWHGLGGAEDEDGELIDPTPGTPGNPAAVGISGSYDFDVTDDMVFRPVLGFDMATEQDAQEDQEMRWEVGTGLNLLWPGLGVDESEEDFLNQEETEVTSGVAFEAVYGSHPTDTRAPGADDVPSGSQATVLLDITDDEDLAANTLAFKLGLYEDSGDDGFLPIVGGALLMNYNMVLANDDDFYENTAVEDGWADFGVGVEFDADLGVVSPYVGFISEMINVTGNDELDYNGDATNGETLTTAFVNVGTDINVIPNTTFNIDYSSGDLLYDAVDEKDQGDDASWGDYYGWTADGGAFSSSQAGQLTFETSIEF